MKKILLAIPLFYFFAIVSVAQDASVIQKKKLTSENADADRVPSIVDVFVPKSDGYPAIRIPALVTSKSGTLLAFAEGRQGGDHSENDIILKRSFDSGKTWEKIQVVHEEGSLSLNNPQPVVLDSGRVLLMYQRSKLGEHNAKPGFGPDSYFTFIQFSDDDGETWSEPADVSKQVKRADGVTSVASGPGIGIVLQRGEHKGRIVMPFNEGPFGVWKVYAAYSDDHGESWKLGDVASDDGKGFGNEVQMVELSDGRLMLNARTQGTGGTKHRKIAWSEDGGHSWTQLQDDTNLIDPVCQASILRYSWPEEGQSRILFSNPASQDSRTNGTLRMSIDEGKTWSSSRVIYPDSFAYSCLTRTKDDRIGILFERDGYATIGFVAVAVESMRERSPSAQANVTSPATYPKGELGEVVRLGEEIVGNTAKHPLSKKYVGNSLNCTSCHLESGRHERAASFLGTAAAYPAWSPREKRVITLEDRVLNCFMRSQNGTRRPNGSQVSVAVTTYITWLSQGSQLEMNPEKPLGPNHTPDLKLDGLRSNIDRGAELYENRCAECHGDNGLGGDDGPPVWGEASYNDGAGLSRVPKLAAWLKVAMPLDDETLTIQESFDIAAFVNSRPRPKFKLSDHSSASERSSEHNGQR